MSSLRSDVVTQMPGFHPLTSPCLTQCLCVSGCLQVSPTLISGWGHQDPPESSSLCSLSPPPGHRLKGGWPKVSSFPHPLPELNTPLISRLSPIPTLPHPRVEERGQPLHGSLPWTQGTSCLC